MRCMMYDIIVFENDKPAFSKKTHSGDHFRKPIFFFFFFPAAAGGGGGRGPENAVYETYEYTPDTLTSIVGTWLL